MKGMIPQSPLMQMYIEILIVITPGESVKACSLLFPLDGILLYSVLFLFYVLWHPPFHLIDCLERVHFIIITDCPECVKGLMRSSTFSKGK